MSDEIVPDNPRVLVIEDNYGHAELIRFYLQEDGCTVQVAEDAQSTFEVIDEFQPDLITVDIGLPDLDGLQVFKALRATWQRTPMIFITIAEELREKALALGATSFISKPFTETQLREAIHNAFHPL